MSPTWWPAHESMVFDQAIAHPNQELLGQDLKGDLGVDVAGYRFGEVMVGAGEQGLVGGLHVP